MPLTSVFLLGLVGVVGLYVTDRVRRRLADGAHRRAGDGDRPVPRFAWLPWAGALGLGVPAAAAGDLLHRAADGHVPAGPVVVLGLLSAAAVLAGLTASAIDLDVHRLPDRLTLPAAAVTLAGLGLATALGAPLADLRRALLAAVALGVVYLVLSFLSGGGIGLGDVKLALPVGALTGWLGWGPMVLAAWGAFALGAVVAVAMLVARRATRRTHLPFGPAIVLAAWGVWVATLLR